MDPFATEKEDLTLKRPDESASESGASKTGVPFDSSGTLTPGRLVAERYKVLSLIGRGAMGAVYEVEQVFLKKHFALKTLSPITSSDVTTRRFQKEALAASKLEHPNLVRAYDFGLIDNSQPFFIMDLVHGVTLAEQLKQVGHLSVASAIEIFVPLCEAMSYAHGLGVIHRDIKPGNIMLARTTNDDVSPRVPKIVDFGIAKLDISDDIAPQTLTKTGDVFGTPLYMSPEQCMGTKINSRTDIYSLGCVLFEALTGAPPFTGSTALETMMQHNSTVAPSLKEASMGLDFPPYLQTIVTKMLAKNANDRYQDCAEVARALGALSNPAELQRLTKSTASADAVGKEKTPIKPLTWLSCVLVGLALVGAAVFSLVHKQAEQPVLPQKVEPSPSKDMNVGDGDTFSKYHAQNAGADTASFRRDGGNVWIFNFGQGTPSIGQYAWSKEPKAPDWIKAQGNPRTPKNGYFFFKVNADILGIQPKLLERFNDGDLYDLEFKPPAGGGLEYSGHDNDLNLAIGFGNHLKSLGELRLSGCLVTMSALTNLDIDKFRHLEKLYLRNTSIDAKQVAQLHLLPDLVEFDISGLKNAAIALRRVAHSKHLKEFYAERDALSDADVLALSTPALATLDVAENPHITSKALRIVDKLPKLTSLDLRGCSIGPDAIAQIIRMRPLYELNISCDTWTLKDLTNLRDHLSQKTRLHIHLHAGRWTEADVSSARNLPGVKVNLQGPRD